VDITGYIITAIAGYLLGSIPTGFLVAKARGVDIRTVGSKNMGATNVFRTLGKGPGIFVLFVDAAKGFIACFCAADGVLNVLHVSNLDPQINHLVGGIAAVLGHNYTCWLNFKGGKGIATTTGVFLALAPAGVGIAIVVWISAFVATRYVSIASILAAIALPLGVWFTLENIPVRTIAIILGLLAIIKHKANIQRLMNGTENRIVFNKPKDAK
jgi:glycerol-3-phosphate acyltransferase PlsY